MPSPVSQTLKAFSRLRQRHDSQHEHEEEADESYIKEEKEGQNQPLTRG